MSDNTSETPFEKIHILAVDDEPGISRLIKLNLQREGFEVDTASNGMEALKMVMLKNYALVISDIMMPEMDGMEFLSHVRQNPETATLPFILLTAKSTDADVTEGYVTGADIYLTKPFSPDELLTWVRRILDDQPKEDSATLIGDQAYYES